jgi:RNA polymerase sigma factor (sigma-70 family)
MSVQELDHTVLLQRCSELVERLIARRGWQLLERDEWVRLTLEQVAADPLTDLQRVAVYIYSQALYAACSGAQGAERQNRGYDELFCYLLDRARLRYPAFAEDVAQRAVECTFNLFERCRVPGAFLAFGAQQLLRAIRDQVRQERRSGWPLDTQEDGHAEAHLVDRSRTDLAGRLIAADLRDRFENLTAEFLRKHPRAGQQLNALRLKYIDELDDVTISQRLGTSVNSVYVLRSRAAEKLRADPAWRALAAEFGIVPEV